LPTARTIAAMSPPDAAVVLSGQFEAAGLSWSAIESNHVNVATSLMDRTVHHHSCPRLVADGIRAPRGSILVAGNMAHIRSHLMPIGLLFSPATPRCAACVGDASRLDRLSCQGWSLRMLFDDAAAVRHVEELLEERGVLAAVSPGSEHHGEWRSRSARLWSAARRHGTQHPVFADARGTARRIDAALSAGLTEGDLETWVRRRLFAGQYRSAPVPATFTFAAHGLTGRDVGAAFAAWGAAPVGPVELAPSLHELVAHWDRRAAQVSLDRGRTLVGLRQGRGLAAQTCHAGPSDLNVAFGGHDTAWRVCGAGVAAELDTMARRSGWEIGAAAVDTPVRPVTFELAESLLADGMGLAEAVPTAAAATR
jgi:hypothetical protein